MLLENIGLKKQTLEAFHNKKIYTVDDVVRYTPYKYLDYREFTPLKDALNKDCLISAYIQNVGQKPNSKMISAEAIEETTGTKITISWFGQSFMLNRIKELTFKQVAVCGKVVDRGRYGICITDPSYIMEKELFTKRIVPVYRKMKGISEQMLHSVIKEALNHVSEPLEHEVLSASKLLTYRDALCKLHYPKTMEDIKKGQLRLVFNDLLYFSMKLRSIHKQTCQKSPCKITSSKKTNQFVSMLPQITGIDTFKLTPDQAQAVSEIKKDMISGVRANYLVQGDVSCGKTMVAILSMFLMAENGYQSVIMVPTTVLAKQHYMEIKSYADILGYKTALLSSEVKQREKNAFLKGIKNGEYQFIVGTHSVISDNVEYNNLGLVVTDEEHRFGVSQREKLQEKAMSGAHIISMSATPIPRSIADIIYGEDKKLCTIKTMPGGRIPVQTAINSSEEVIYNFIEKQLNEKHQCYVICPLIHEEEKTDETQITKTELNTVLKALDCYKKRFEPYGYSVGMVNGKMPKEEIIQTLDDFKKGNVQILVSTTVVEVGVNVPNATVIVINNAERFGLAQLHQLRGRVGRGKLKSYCILNSTDKANEKLNVLVNSTDGFVVAQEDAKLRGMGDIIGTKQSGNNKYIQLLLSFPNLYQHVKKYTDWMMQYHMGNNLMNLYEENELAKEAVA